MRFVTVKDDKFDNCIRLVHLRDRNWQPEDIPEALLREVFEDWDDAGQSADDEFMRELRLRAMSL